MSDDAQGKDNSQIIVGVPTSGCGNVAARSMYLLRFFKCSTTIRGHPKLNCRDKNCHVARLNWNNSPPLTWHTRAAHDRHPLSQRKGGNICITA